MKKIIWKLFTLRLFENILLFFIGRYPSSVFLRKLAPMNHYYSSPSLRTCTRFGIHYELDISDYQNWLLYFHCSVDSSFAVTDYIKPGNNILDIGGNIGQTALMMAKKAGSTGKVFSFEPYPATYQKFTRNLELNPGLKNNISVYNLALGNTETVLKMYKDCLTNSGGNRMLHPGTDKTDGLTEVPVTTLDTFLMKAALPRIHFIKIDVEGFEMNVIKGAAGTLQKWKPSLFIELDDRSLKAQGSSAAELVETVRNFGYSVFEEGSNTELANTDLYRHMNIFCSVQ